MSECVVRMEMPESCDVCPCLDDYGDYPRCRISGEQRGYNFPTREKRMPNCPIICSLPEGHGPLVDAEKLKEQSVHFCETEYTFDFDAVFIEDINEASTVVPAERSKI